MLIVNIPGGIGNQMYAYALYRTLLERGRDVYMCLADYKVRPLTNLLRALRKRPKLDRRDYILPQVFNVVERRIGTVRELSCYLANKLHLSYVYKDKEKGFDPAVFQKESGYLWGWWQSFKYSDEIRNILRKEFTFKKPLTGKSADIIDKIKGCNSISISVRRGDYVRLGWALPDEWYLNAMRYMQSRFTDAKFFCTSDDIDWCKRYFADKGADITFIDWSNGSDQYFDMQVIQECKHNILANSTFCLWGAWLNSNPDPVIVRPDKYTKYISTECNEGL